MFGKAIVLVTVFGAVYSASLVPGGPCEGNGYISNPDDCTTYYQCVHGVLYLQHCPGGLYWDSISKVCNFLANVRSSACGGSGGAEPTTTRATTTTTTTAQPGVTTTTKATTTKAPVPPPADLTCPSSEGYRYYAYGSSGTQFFLCSLGTPSGPYNCGAGLSFSVDDQACTRA